MRKNLKVTIFLNVFFCLLCFFNCKELFIEENQSLPQKKELDSNKEELTQSYAYILNQNGVILYEKAFDFKTKMLEIPYSAKVILTHEPINSESIEVNQWFSAIYNRKKGFIHTTDHYKSSDWIILDKLEAYNESTKKSEPAYSIIQSPKTTLYELPSLDSKPIGELEQFNLVNILSSGNSYDPFISNNIDLEMGSGDRNWYEVVSENKKGFILNSINYPTTKMMALDQANHKILNQKGYFLLTAKSPTLFEMESKLPIRDKYTVKLKETNVFLDSSETRLLNGEQVYLVNLGNKIKLKKKESQNVSEDIPYSAYILAKDGMYFTEQKFSDYTVANTKFKGDLNAITFVRNEFEKRGIYLNYMNFSLTKIAGGEFPKESYYIASANVNYPNSDLSDTFSTRSIILKQNDGVYEVVSGSIYTSTPIRFKDLDKDGEMEIIVKAPTRGGEETLIYGLLDGKYQSLNYLLYNMNFYEIELKGDKIKAKKWITSEGTNTETPKIQFFKYQKGSFVEIK